jgi:integrase
MRGSTYYQTAILTKYIFQESAKKTEKIDPNHQHYLKVSSYKTMETYRNVWNNFFNYLREHWNLNNCELIQDYHVEAYIEYKLEYYPSVLYIQKISAAIGKLEVALKFFTKDIYGSSKFYDFSIRQDVLNESRDLKLVANNYHNRTYNNPLNVISKLEDSKHRLAAKIQLEGGARIEGVALIKKEQLHGYIIDEITNTKKGIIFTKEKGGKEGDVLVSIQTYDKLKDYISEFGQFRIKRQKYYLDIIKSCILSNETQEGSHSFRWSFIKRRMFEYAQAGYTYDKSLLEVSNEIKHNRPKITEHYLGG